MSSIPSAEDPGSGAGPSQPAPCTSHPHQHASAHGSPSSGRKVAAHRAHARAGMVSPRSMSGKMMHMAPRRASGDGSLAELAHAGARAVGRHSLDGGAGHPPWSAATAAAHRSSSGGGGVSESSELEATQSRGYKEGGGAGWLLTAAVVLKASMGIGTLALPADFARLGWLLALGWLAALAAAVTYSGCLYTRVLSRSRQADAMMLHQLARRALGPRGVAAVYCTVYLTILLLPAIFHITAVEALRQLFPKDAAPSRLLSGFVVLVMAVGLAQLQSLTQMGVASMLGSGAMLLAVGVTVAKLLLQPPSPEHGGCGTAARIGGGSGNEPPPHTDLLPHTSFPQAMVGVLNMLFAFGGQENWMRILVGMRNRQHFARAVALSTSVLAPAMAAVGAVGYWTCGSYLDMSRPITSLLHHDSWSVTVNACLFVSVMISYMININVWTRMMLGLFGPRAMRVNTTASGHHHQHHRHHHHPHKSEAGTSFGPTHGSAPGGASLEQQHSLQSEPAADAGAGDACGKKGLGGAGTAASTQARESLGGQDLEHGASTRADGHGSEGAAALASSDNALLQPLLPKGEVEEAGGQPGHVHCGRHGGGSAGGAAPLASRPMPHGEPQPLPEEQNLLWLILSMCAGCYGYVAGFLLPYYAEVMAVVTSIGYPGCLLVFPCLFALRLLPLRPAERALCWALVGVAGALSAVGAVMSLERLVARAREE